MDFDFSDAEQAFRAELRTREGRRESPGYAERVPVTRVRTPGTDALPGEAEQGVDALAPEADDQLAVDRHDGRREDVAALEEIGRFLVGHHVAHPEHHACGPQVVLETFAGASERRRVEDDLGRHHGFPVPLSALSAAFRASHFSLSAPSRNGCSLVSTFAFQVVSVDHS